MGFAAAILGASGYGGGELLRLLSAHPQCASVQALARTAAGKPVHSVHPALRGVVEQDFVATVDWAALGAAAQPVLFAALPHGEFAKLYADLRAQWLPHGLDDRLIVIDLSGDFRLDSPAAHEQSYGGAHPLPELLAEFVYGLSEVNAEAIARANRIACPGCFATAIELALWPLSQFEPAQQPSFIAVSAITGSSGSGASASDTTHHPTRAHDFRAYKVLGHQHQGEIEMLLRGAGLHSPIAFVPHSAPIVRGIYVTATFALPPTLTPQQLSDAYTASYQVSDFVRLTGGVPRLGAVIGSNFVDLHIAIRGNVATVLLALDNLVKGMAGQAMQNLNLRLGYPARTGLGQTALYPG